VTRAAGSGLADPPRSVARAPDLGIRSSDQTQCTFRKSSGRSFRIVT
jgi:hypothetical protein